MIHTVIVPGVGGSEQHHWQSWLQRQLQSCSRVEQADWHRPVLSEWVEQLAKHVRSIHGPVQLVAHSFGCLTSLATLKEHPDLTHKIKHLTLVAPANPARFGDAGFARDSTNNYLAYFESLRPIVRTQLLMSENDPWLHVQDAQHLAHCWKLKAVSLGHVGHINVASGFGPFPEIFDYILPEKQRTGSIRARYSNRFFGFAL